MVVAFCRNASFEEGFVMYVEKLKEIKTYL